MIRPFATWIGLAAGVWAAGLGWFIANVPLADRSATPSDAIVVLTGGSRRLETGFALLRDGKGRVMFVSGVNPHVGLADLLRVAGNAPDWARCCVVLGHSADTTLGNAVETAGWVEQQGYRSLRLVTAWYHMPRSLLEFERAMPDVNITPHPVFPEGVERDRWWQARASADLVIGEYHKYLAALFRPLVLRLRQRLAPRAPATSLP